MGVEGLITCMLVGGPQIIGFAWSCYLTDIGHKNDQTIISKWNWSFIDRGLIICIVSVRRLNVVQVFDAISLQTVRSNGFWSMAQNHRATLLIGKIINHRIKGKIDGGDWAIRLVESRPEKVIGAVLFHLKSGCVITSRMREATKSQVGTMQDCDNRWSGGWSQR